MSKELEGIIRITGRGSGVFTLPDNRDEISISENNLGTSLDGDVVKIAVGKDGVGKVQEVVKRARETFVGVVEEDRDRLYLVPDDRRIHVDIAIPRRWSAKAKSGDKALVDFVEYRDASTNPLGRVRRVLGRAGEHEAEIQGIALLRGFDTSFPPEVLKEAENLARRRKIENKDLACRKDFRDVTTFTIDPETAKDFDDALSVEFLDGGNTRVGIHIADVTHYVTKESKIDLEARKRGTSVYLVDRTIPMLPDVLSNDLCSLNEKEDKRTFSAVFTLGSDGKIVDRWFGKTLMASNKRFTYKEAQAVLDRGSGEYAKELRALSKIANRLREQREQEGSINFEQDEVNFELNEDGVPIEVYRKERYETMKIIEDFMLLANKEVTLFVRDHSKLKKEHNRTFVYRVHDAPDPDRIDELKIFLRATGHDFKVRDESSISPADINRLLREVEGTSEENLVQTAVLRTMSRATYSTKNIGHFGLGFPYYTHFTSPIRRYPDILVHRLLFTHLDETVIDVRDLDELEALATSSSVREVEATDAERESIKYKQVEFLSGKVGQIFEAVISGVTDWGIFVQEKNTLSEGLVRYSTLRDDHYEFHKSKYAAIGTRTRKKYSLGDEVRVKLLSANKSRRTLDFEILDQATNSHKKATSRL